MFIPQTISLAANAASLARKRISGGRPSHQASRFGVGIDWAGFADFDMQGRVGGGSDMFKRKREARLHYVFRNNYIYES